MNLTEIKDQKTLLEYIRDAAMLNGNLSARGVSRLAGLHDHKALISGGYIRSQKLAEKLTGHGFDGGDLIKNGFPPDAVILVLEYYAYDSKAEAEGAKAILRTFGVIGVITTLKALSSAPEPKFKSQPTSPRNTDLNLSDFERLELAKILLAQCPNDQIALEVIRESIVLTKHELPQVKEKTLQASNWQLPLFDTNDLNNGELNTRSELATKLSISRTTVIKYGKIAQESIPDYLADSLGAEQPLTDYQAWCINQMHLLMKQLRNVFRAKYHILHNPKRYCKQYFYQAC